MAWKSNFVLVRGGEPADIAAWLGGAVGLTGNLPTEDPRMCTAYPTDRLLVSGNWCTAADLARGPC